MKMARFLTVMICVGIALLFLGSCGQRVTAFSGKETATPSPAIAPTLTLSPEPGPADPIVMGEEVISEQAEVLEVKDVFGMGISRNAGETGPYRIESLRFIQFVI